VIITEANVEKLFPPDEPIPRCFANQLEEIKAAQSHVSIATALPAEKVFASGVSQPGEEIASKHLPSTLPPPSQQVVANRRHHAIPTTNTHSSSPEEIELDDFPSESNLEWSSSGKRLRMQDQVSTATSTACFDLTGAQTQEVKNVQKAASCQLYNRPPVPEPQLLASRSSSQPLQNSKSNFAPASIRLRDENDASWLDDDD